MPFNCEINSGYRIGCTGIGGIKEVFIGNWEKFNITYDAGGLNIIETIESDATPANPITIYRVEQKAEWAGLNGTGVHNIENDTFHASDVLVIKASILDAETLAFLKNLKRTNSFAIVRSNLDQLYFLGADIPGRSIESTQSLGTSFEDMNGGTVNLEFKSADGMVILSENAFSTEFVIAEPLS
jgi:hypothetical protein